MEWTSTLLVKYSEFRASFTQPTGLVTAYQVDFCKEVNPKRDKNDGFIAPGQEYREIFKKITRNLLGHSVNVELYCKVGEFDIISRE